MNLLRVFINNELNKPYVIYVPKFIRTLGLANGGYKILYFRRGEEVRGLVMDQNRPLFFLYLKFSRGQSNNHYFVLLVTRLTAW